MILFAFGFFAGLLAAGFMALAVGAYLGAIHDLDAPTGRGKP